MFDVYVKRKYAGYGAAERTQVSAMLKIIVLYFPLALFTGLYFLIGAKAITFQVEWALLVFLVVVLLFLHFGKLALAKVLFLGPSFMAAIYALFLGPQESNVFIYLPAVVILFVLFSNMIWTLSIVLAYLGVLGGYYFYPFKRVVYNKFFMIDCMGGTILIFLLSLLIVQFFRKNIEEKNVLIKEMHHRVKNNMQIISGLLQLQVMQAKNQEAKELLADSEARIYTMALAHEMVYQNDNLSQIDLKVFLEKLVLHAKAIYETTERNIDIEIESDTLLTSMEKALPLAQIINEFISNSFKHAFKNQEQGKIRIACKEKDKRLFCEFKDNGAGFPSDFQPEMADSLGLSLIISLCRQLGGMYVFGNEGGVLLRIELDC